MPAPSSFSAKPCFLFSILIPTDDSAFSRLLLTNAENYINQSPDVYTKPTV